MGVNDEVNYRGALLSATYVVEACDVPVRTRLATDRLETSLTPVDLTERSLDSAIRRGPGNWTGLTSDFLFRDVLFPVATPEFAETLDLSQGEKILETVPLLHDPGDPTEWSRWLRASGCSGARMRLVHSFTDSLVMLSAIAGGTKGVALINSILVERELLDGRLVRLFETTIPTQYPYYLVYPQGRRLSPSMRAFRSWLLSEAESVGLPAHDFPNAQPTHIP